MRPVATLALIQASTVSGLAPTLRLSVLATLMNELAAPVEQVDESRGAARALEAVALLDPDHRQAPPLRCERVERACCCLLLHEQRVPGAAPLLLAHDRRAVHRAPLGSIT